CQRAKDQACASVLGHVNVVEPLHWATCASLCHIEPGIAFVYLRDGREVVLGRGGRSRPFQGTAAPWVVADGVSLTVTDTDINLDNERKYAEQDQDCAKCCNDKPDLQTGVFEVAEAAGDAHQAQYIKWTKGHPEANQPEPERQTSPELVQAETEGFGEPVVDGCKNTEHHTANNDVMKVCNQEQTV